MDVAGGVGDGKGEEGRWLRISAAWKAEASTCPPDFGSGKGLSRRAVYSYLCFTRETLVKENPSIQATATVQAGQPRPGQRWRG